MKCTEKLKALPFLNDIKGRKGEVYAVGGAVRDEFMGKESKDLDILVTGIPEEELVAILEKHGKVDQVGKSFGIIKFKAEGQEEVDVALPRTEKKKEGEGGHKAFDVVVDHTLTVEQDLARRDFTFNAIAIRSDGTIIDPYEGTKAIAERKLISVAPTSYTDDPLRILRAIQFSARFAFTFNLEECRRIEAAKEGLQYISGERISIEIKKACNGDAKTAARFNLLMNAKDFGKESILKTILKYLFERTPDSINYFGNDSLITGGFNNISHYIQHISNAYVGVEDVKQLGAALHLSREECSLASALIELRRDNTMGVFPAVSKHPEIIKDTYEGKYKFNRRNDNVLRLMYIGEIPKTLGELAVNGNDFLRWGFEGPELGSAYKKAILAIVNRTIENDAFEIEQWVLHNNK